MLRSRSKLNDSDEFHDTPMRKLIRQMPGMLKTYLANIFCLLLILCIFLLSIERFNQTFSREAKFRLTINFEIPIHL
jgi:hypothetical protein